MAQKRSGSSARGWRVGKSAKPIEVETLNQTAESPLRIVNDLPCHNDEGDHCHNHQGVWKVLQNHGVLPFCSSAHSRCILR